jgi:RHS repeat-associated protein
MSINDTIRLALDPITINQDGYIYVWVSNQSKQARVWFDDLKVALQGSFVTQATDYGVWGDVIREQKSDESIYRYGYQGQFSERDLATGWNHFELRDYDPVIGRWTAVDPKRIGWSPYIGMYNNPVTGTDPDGGGPNDWFKNQNGEAKWFASSAEGFSDSEGNSWTNIGTELLNFDGQFLTHLWQTGNEFDGFSVFSRSYHAVSGAPIDDNGWATFDYSAARQQLKNVGPIPEGLYSINKSGLQLLSDMPSYKQLLAPFGVTSWPGGSSSWGYHRWWPTPESTTDTFGRSGFTIHGGVAWGSRGCIDLGTGMTGFVRDFMGNASNEKVYLNVKYTTPSISIIPYGNIWKQR